MEVLEAFRIHGYPNEIGPGCMTFILHMSLQWPK
jgi:hypothetical protein